MFGIIHWETISFELSAEVVSNRHGFYALTYKDYLCLATVLRFNPQNKLIALQYMPNCLRLSISFFLSLSLQQIILYLDTNFPVLISRFFFCFTHSFECKRISSCTNRIDNWRVRLFDENSLKQLKQARRIPNSRSNKPFRTILTRKRHFGWQKEKGRERW